MDRKPEEEIVRLAKSFQSLKSVLRLRILALLAEGDSNVTAMQEHLRVSQPLLSWHLNKLRLAGFVEAERIGREVLYQLRYDAFCVVLQDLGSLLGLSVQVDEQS